MEPPQPPPAFWQAIDSLIATSHIVIDRPRGTPHPRISSFIYPLDYGYLAGTMSGDGAGIDIWRGTLATATVTAVVCAIDLAKRDMEMKLLLGCTPAEIDQIAAIHNVGDQSAFVLTRQ